LSDAAGFGRAFEVDDLESREQNKVAAVVLAAGRGERFGGDVPKPLVMFRGRALVAHALDAARGSDLEPVVVVVGNAAEDVSAAIAADDVVVVCNDQWGTGIASSLVAALRALEARPGVDAVVVGLADQPLVGAEAYRRLAGAYDDGARLAVATYGGVRGNPVLLARDHLGEAMALTGDEGARVLLRRGGAVEVPCDGTGSPTDVDTPADLAALEG
jgi:CTP:molybdopterin cytidylyltransferase MocA